MRRRIINWWQQRRENQHCKAWSELFDQQCNLRTGHGGNHRPSRDTRFIEWYVSDEGVEKTVVNRYPPYCYVASIEAQRSMSPDEPLTERELVRIAQGMARSMREAHEEEE